MEPYSDSEWDSFYAKTTKDACEILSGGAKRACERDRQNGLDIWSNWDSYGDITWAERENANEKSKNDGMTTQVLDPSYKYIWIIDKKKVAIYS